MMINADIVRLLEDYKILKDDEETEEPILGDILKQIGNNIQSEDEEKIKVKKGDIAIVTRKFLNNKISGKKIEHWAEGILFMEDVYDLLPDIPENSNEREIYLQMLHLLAIPKNVRGYTINHRKIKHFLDCIKKGENIK